VLKEIIESEYRKTKSDFDLKSVVKKYEIYKSNFFDFFLEKYIKEEFKNALFKSRSEFIRFILSGNIINYNKTKPTIVYKATVKLIGQTKELLKMEEKFKMVEPIQNCFCYKNEDKKYDSLNLTVFSWFYLNLKDYFADNAYRLNFSYSQINQMVSIIDEVFNRELTK
jgi:hypothetical protein